MKIIDNQEKVQSAMIDFLRFPLAIAVLFIHMGNTVSCLAKADFSLFSGEGIYNIVCIVGSYTLSHLAVPLFFLISGFLFFRKMTIWTWSFYTSSLRKRCFTLLIPYLIWNLIAASFDLQHLIQSGFSIFWDSIKFFLNSVNWLGWKHPFYAPQNLPLWFIRDLMVMCILSPCVYWMIKHKGVWMLLLFSLLFVFDCFPYIVGLDIKALLFFSLGAYFAIEKKNLVEEMNRYKKNLYLLAFIFLIISIYFHGYGSYWVGVCFRFFILTGVGATIALGGKIACRITMPSILVRSCMFVYAGHVMLLGNVHGFVLNIMPGVGLIKAMPAYLIAPFITAFLLVSLYYVMDRYMKPVCRVLSGMR